MIDARARQAPDSVRRRPETGAAIFAGVLSDCVQGRMFPSLQAKFESHGVRPMQAKEFVLIFVTVPYLLELKVLTK